MVDGRRDGLKGVGNLPKNFAVGRMFDVALVEAGDFLIAIQHHAHAVAAGTFFEESMNASGAPQGNHVGLRDHEHSIRKIGEQVGGGIETAGSVDNYETVVINQKVEEPG